jgi:hypothetical protein
MTERSLNHVVSAGDCCMPYSPPPQHEEATPASTRAAAQAPIAIPAFAPVAKLPKLPEVVSSYFRVKICSVMTVIPGIVALIAGTNV